MSKLANALMIATCLALIGFGGVQQYAPQWLDAAAGWSPWATSGKAEIVVIDATPRSPTAAEVHNSKAVADEAAACKLFRWIDATASGPDIAEVQWALDAAKSSKPPVVCLRRGSKVTVKALPTPATAFVTWMKSNGG
jgi:hypothetical protein